MKLMYGFNKQLLAHEKSRCSATTEYAKIWEVLRAFNTETPFLTQFLKALFHWQGEIRLWRLQA